MPFSSVAVANEFLNLAQSAGKSLTQMQLQKLVFFAHGWYLALTDRPLIDEQVEAWRFGPVIRSLYAKFREYGSSPVSHLYSPMVYEETDDGLALNEESPPRVEGSEEAAFARRVIARVWDVYGGFTAYQLSNMTHLPGTPWHEVVSGYEDRGLSIPKGTDIPADRLKAYFQELGRSRGVAVT